MKKLILIGGGVIVAVVIAIIILSTGDNMKYEKVSLKTIDDITEAQLQNVSWKRIYFGHQSVGFNIIKGLEELDKKIEALQLNIIETTEPVANEGPVFIHSRVGKNKKPNSKVDDFARIIGQLKDNVDIACFKFCYADIGKNTNIESVFQYYKKTMKQLEEKYPNILFIHSTIPYYKKSGGVKNILKNLTGKDNNINRNRFNRLLTKEYKEERIFDLGKFESTYPDGKRETSAKNIFTLVTQYTDDGGHLNAKGREIIALQFLDFLASLK
ncbi:MAG: hypothetical protein GY757_22200 [bacterium]|nr:hypothetical protein [bacterium]